MLLTDSEIELFVKKIESINRLKEKNKALQEYLKIWEDIPEPKQDQPQQLANWVIDCIYMEYFDLKDFVNAKKWAIIGLNNDTAKDDSYEYFQMGRVCYELNELDEAMKYFDIAYQRGKKRAFQEYDKKYWKFYSENKK